MKLNKRFNVIGTIGNCHDLLPVPRIEPTHSYHVHDPRTTKEVAIRYDAESARDAAQSFMERTDGGYMPIVRKPIFREIPPDVNN